MGASTGPGGTVVPVLLCEFAEANPEVTIDLTISDTQTIVDRVARRELELGVVGATPRNRSVAYEPFFRDEVVLVCPPGHRFAGKTVSLDDLRGERLIVDAGRCRRPPGDRGRAARRAGRAFGTSTSGSSSASRSP